MNLNEEDLYISLEEEMKQIIPYAEENIDKELDEWE
jgi:hypothetical protein